MRIYKRILKLIFFIIIFFIAYSFGVAVFEDARVNTHINEFRARASSEPVLTQVVNGMEFRYFSIPRREDEKHDRRSVFSDDNRLRPGVRGDIIASRESPFPQIPIIHQFVSFYFGGHASLIIGDNELIEATGMGVTFTEMIQMIFHRGFDRDERFPQNIVTDVNYWLTRPRPSSDPAASHYNYAFRNEVIGLRVRYATDETFNQAIDYAIDKMNNRALYNFLFFLSTRYKYYCTDLISRAFAHAYNEHGRRVNLNFDGFITSVSDIVLARDTFMTIYSNIFNGVRHIYFLEDIE
jgi:hypothetical protein